MLQDQLDHFRLDKAFNNSQFLTSVFEGQGAGTNDFFPRFGIARPPLAGRAFQQ